MKGYRLLNLLSSLSSSLLQSFIVQSLVLVSNPMIYLYGSLPIQASAALSYHEKYSALQVGPLVHRTTAL
jgi:hypothetical protein